MKTKLSKYTLILSLIIGSFSASYADSTQFFSTESVTVSGGNPSLTDPSQEGDPLLQNDTLPDNNISGSKAYSVDLGEATSTVTKDDKGNIIIKDENGTDSWGSSMDYKNPKRNDTEAQTYWDEYESYSLEENLTVKREKAREMREKSDAEAMRRGSTVKENRQTLLTGRNPLSSGPGFVNRAMQPDPSLEYDQTGLKEVDENMSKVYGTHVTLSIKDAQRDRIKEANIGALSTLYDTGLDGIISEMTNRLKAATVQCVISRELTPAYFCPISGKDGLYFGMGSGRNLDIAAVRDECNDYCHTDPGTLSCFGTNVPGIGSTELSSAATFQVYPESGTYPKHLSFTFSDKMPVKTIGFKVKFPKPASMTEQEWIDKLSATPIYFKYTITSRDSSPEGSAYAPEVITDRALITVNSSNISVKVPVHKILKDTTIEFFKPFFTQMWGDEYLYAEDKTFYEGTGSKITVYDLNASYESNKYYYCMAKQMVYTPAQCVGGDTFPVSSGDAQFNYVCGADSKKIGPEPTYGAFYDEDSCQNACIERKECVATYSHYGTYGAPETILKSEVKCLDSDGNGPSGGNNNCSDSLCQALFAQGDAERPVNEYLIANDDTYIYTVRNKVLTDHPRPKINLGAELQSNPDFDQIQVDEEKDASFLYMIKNLTYNRVSYVIGDESPANMAYVLSKNSTGDKTGVHLLLKPASFDYDDGSKYLYAVLVTEHMYHPIAGTFTTSSGTVASSDQELLLKDITYAIKQNEGPLDSWYVFRTKQFAQVRVYDTQSVTQDDGTTQVQNTYKWVDNDPYLRDIWGRYDQGTDSLVAISPTSTAKSFKSMTFDAVKDYFQFTLSSWIEHDLRATPGLLFRDQEKINHDTDIHRIFDKETFNHQNQSRATDYWVFLTYSDAPLTYQELINKIEGGDYANKIKVGTDTEWAGYELTNSQKFREGEIKYDGEINNVVKVLKKGAPTGQTVSVNWEPTETEKGKRVFKFIFLFDETDTDLFDYSSYVN